MASIFKPNDDVGKFVAAEAASPTSRAAAPAPLAINTPRLGLIKPTVGGDADQWGEMLNQNSDTLDAKVARIDGSNNFTVAQGIDVTDNTNAALQINQQGTGLALVVGDQAHPDPTPFVVDNAGNVGVGTASPEGKLDVRGTVFTEPGNAGNLLFFNTGRTNNYYLQNVGPAGAGLGVLTFNQGGVGERMRLNAAGNLGIGTSFPNAKLDVNGPAGVTSFTGTSKLGFTIRGNIGTADYSGIDFCGTSSEAYARIGSRTTVQGSTIEFGTSNNYAQGITNLSMTINQIGNIGIGTPGPSCRLHVDSPEDEVFRINAPSSPYLSIYRANVREFYLQATASAVYQVVETAKPLIWQANSYGEALRINSNGRIGVGATAPEGRLHIIPGELSFPALFVSGYNGGAPAAVYRTASASGIVVQEFQNASSIVVGRINSGPSSTTYATSSDYRLKEDVKPVENAVQRVMLLKPVNFAWKIDGTRVDGFLAHEAQEVVPDAVTGAKDAVRSVTVEDEVTGHTRTEEVPEYQGIDQSKMVPLLTAALQEAITKMAALEARIAMLEAK